MLTSTACAMLDRAMLRPDDFIASRREALRSFYAEEIDALKRRGRQRRIFRSIAGAMVSVCLVAVLATGHFGRREVVAGTSPMVVNLGEGSRIHLDAGAAIEIPLVSWRREVRLLAGDAVFDIAHDDAHPFVAFVGETRLTDLGTRFMVKTSGPMTHVSVFEGRVEVFRPSDPPRILDVGQAAMVGTAGIAAAPFLDEVEATAWRQGRMVFRDATLGEVAERMSRYRTRPIRAGDPAVAGLRVSGTFRLDDLDGAVKTLAQAIPISVRDDGGATLLLPRR